MAGNKYISDSAVAYVLKRFWSRPTVWGHVEGGIHRQISSGFSRMLCLRCYKNTKSLLSRITLSNFIIKGLCENAEQETTIR